jgi:Ca2+-binding RTX toxin-like protein
VSEGTFNPQGTLVLAALERAHGEITSHTLEDSSQSSAIDLNSGALYSNFGSSGSDADAVVPGNDFIDGGEGADVIFGNEGSDTIALTDSFGNDVIEGGEDDGDSDVDVLDISGLTSGAAVDLSANGASDVESGTVTVGGDTATFSEIENIAFTDNGDTVKGSGGDDDLDLGAGNDIVDGGDGDDTIDGGDGDDSIDGGAGSDSLTGGEGSDTIDGGEGADTSDGGAGDDDLVAGGGDSVTGGAGDDEFTIDSSVSDTGDITIVGGETDEEGSVDPTNNPDGEVGDILDLNGLDHVVVTYDQTDPTWDGTTSESGTVTYTNDAGDTVTVNFSEI